MKISDNRLLQGVLSVVLLVFAQAGCQNPAPKNGEQGAEPQAQGVAPAQGQEPPHIVFLISEDSLNYEAPRTIPPFAEMLEKEHGFRTTVLLGEGERIRHYFAGLEVLKEDADLLVVFCRRLALKPEQMDLIKGYIGEGKPVVGIRTANHAFSLREEVPEGYVDWWDFVPEVLGCENRGYEPEPLGTEVKVLPEQRDHPILRNIGEDGWHGKGSVYKVAPLLDAAAVVLLTGSTENATEPVAWTRQTDAGGRVFYTSLGYPDDFGLAPFRTLLTNGIYWALGEDRD